MIDGKKLLENLIPLLNEHGDMYLAGRIIGMVDSQQKIGEWIPCSERLPEENQPVWVSVQYQGGDIESVEGIFKNGELCRMNGIGLGFIAEAWMPRCVPEPYIASDRQQS